MSPKVYHTGQTFTGEKIPVTRIHGIFDHENWHWKGFKAVVPFPVVTCVGDEPTPSILVLSNLSSINRVILTLHVADHANCSHQEILCGIFRNAAYSIPIRLTSNDQDSSIAPISDVKDLIVLVTI